MQHANYNINFQIMKKIWIVLLIGIAFPSMAQHKKKNTLIGFQIGVQNPPSLPSSISIPTFKLGIPSFSYAASIENRFTIRNQLSFSLQYALNYYQLNQQLLPLRFKQQYIAISTDAVVSMGVSKKSSVLIGGGISQPVYTKTANFQTAELGVYKSESTFSIANLYYLQTHMIIGIENRTKLFNKNLYYSLQYNFGFMPLRYRLASPAPHQGMQQGVSIGLKFMY